MFVSRGCCNLEPQTEGLKRADIYFLTAWEARSSKPRCCQGRFLPEALRKKPSPAFAGFWELLESLSFLGYGPVPPASASVFTPTSLRFSVSLSVCYAGHSHRMYHPQVDVLPP